MSQVSDVVRKSFKENDDVRDAGLATPESVERFDDISYGSDDACQKLDVYRPKDRKGETLPVIVSVHGGGWVYGDKERYQYYCMSLTEFGFAVVNFTYRLAPEYQHPAPLCDTNLVVEWILSHAEEYGLDKEHIFAVGDSAGGTTLGLYTAACTNPSYAATLPFTIPAGFKPAAVALNCGDYQFEEIKEGEQADGMDALSINLMNDYLPGGPVQSELNKICVPLYVTPDFVPTCIMTCTGDFLMDQAPILAEKLTACKVPFTYLFYGDKDHELGHVFHLNMKSEEAHACNETECGFFKKFL